MKRLQSLLASRIAALAILVTVLVGPMVHGSLAHGHPARDSEASLDRVPVETSVTAAARVCPVCFAGEPGRSGIATSLVGAMRSDREAIPRTAPGPCSTSVDLAPAAPRAPPVSS